MDRRSNNNRVLRHEAAHTKVNGADADGVLGAPTTTTDLTRVFRPYGIAIDPVSGKLFVADEQRNRVLRFASAQSLASGAGAEAVFGQADFSGRDEGTAANRMKDPSESRRGQSRKSLRAGSRQQSRAAFQQCGATSKRCRCRWRAGSAKFQYRHVPTSFGDHLPRARVDSHRSIECVVGFPPPPGNAFRQRFQPKATVRRPMGYSVRPTLLATSTPGRLPLCDRGVSLRMPAEDSG